MLRPILIFIIFFTTFFTAFGIATQRAQAIDLLSLSFYQTLVKKYGTNEQVLSDLKNLVDTTFYWESAPKDQRYEAFLKMGQIQRKLATETAMIPAELQVLHQELLRAYAAAPDDAQFMKLLYNFGESGLRKTIFSLTEMTDETEVQRMGRNLAFLGADFFNAAQVATKAHSVEPYLIPLRAHLFKFLFAALILDKARDLPKNKEAQEMVAKMEAMAFESLSAFLEDTRDRKLFNIEEMGNFLDQALRDINIQDPAVLTRDLLQTWNADPDRTFKAEMLNLSNKLMENARESSPKRNLVAGAGMYWGLLAVAIPGNLWLFRHLHHHSSLLGGGMLLLNTFTTVVYFVPFANFYLSLRHALGNSILPKKRVKKLLEDLASLRGKACKLMLQD